MQKKNNQIHEPLCRMPPVGAKRRAHALDCAIGDTAGQLPKL